MPIWLRRFTFRSIEEWYEEQNKQQEQPQQNNNIPKGPDISPSYSTKASK